MAEVLAEKPVKKRTQNCFLNINGRGFDRKPRETTNRKHSFRVSIHRREGCESRLKISGHSSKNWRANSAFFRRYIQPGSDFLLLITTYHTYEVSCTVRSPAQSPFRDWSILGNNEQSNPVQNLYEYVRVRVRKVCINTTTFIPGTYVRTVVRTAVSNVVILYSQLHFVPGSIFRTYSPSAIGAEGGVALSPGIVLLRTYDKYDFNIILDILVLQYGTRMIRTRIR